MKRLFFATITVLAFTLTGCSTYQYSARQAGINRQDIQATPTIVDVKADFTKRVEVTSGWCPTKSDAMAECNYRAITENKIDLVVDPIYKIEYRILKRKFKASLIGFAGYYTNSRTQIEDMELIKKLTREDIENARAQGKRIKLLCRGRVEDGKPVGVVRPTLVDEGSLPTTMQGTASYVTIDTDLMGATTIIEEPFEPEIDHTAYGVLSDLLRILTETQE